MSTYTTGELAKLCDVSVRTVQFYDTKDLLKPSALTEGGRRLYSEDDLKKLRLICLLKFLGLSLEAVKGILESEHPEKVLMVFLNEQEKQLDSEIDQIKKQKKAIEIVLENLHTTNHVSVESIGDMDKIMNEEKYRKAFLKKMLIFGIPMTLLEDGAAILWIVTGIWWPFAVIMPVALLIGSIIFVKFHDYMSYICPECGTTFQPTAWNLFWARHTPKTRKLKCTSCGYTGWCVERFTRNPDERGA